MEDHGKTSDFVAIYRKTDTSQGSCSNGAGVLEEIQNIVKGPEYSQQLSTPKHVSFVYLCLPLIILWGWFIPPIYSKSLGMVMDGLGFSPHKLFGIQTEGSIMICSPNFTNHLNAGKSGKVHN